MELVLEAITEGSAGVEFQRRFKKLWPSYRQWYLSDGIASRPTYLACERAIAKYLPKILPCWQRMIDLIGGGDLEARFLSLYAPPPYISSCSQSVWVSDEPILVRNYDYSANLFEKLLWKTKWNDRTVIAMSDCLIGALDGMNDDGLVVSLNFGGSRDVGEGFGAPLLVRYLLESCSSTQEAASILKHVPLHMAYNILVLDRSGDFLTAYFHPQKKTILRRTEASTNHQDGVNWPRHAEATATMDRERCLYELLAKRDLEARGFINAFLQPPLYQTKYKRGYGTLYTAAYYPVSERMELHWPGFVWKKSFVDFSVDHFKVTLPSPYH